MFFITDFDIRKNRGKVNGFASLRPNDISKEFVLMANIENPEKEVTFVHELGHILGLRHTFEHNTINPKRKNIEKYSTRNLMDYSLKDRRRERFFKYQRTIIEKNKKIYINKKEDKK